MAEYLNEAVRRGQTSALRIAASAQVLHGIREGLSKEAAGKVEKTLNKHYTNSADAELAAHFD